MVFERLARRLQAVTNHRYAWFGEFWDSLVLIQGVELLAVTSLLALKVDAQIDLMKCALVLPLVLLIDGLVGGLTIVSVLLDEHMGQP